MSGANVSATDKLKLDIKGDLTVESLQDEYYASGNSWDVNIGIGIGTGDMGSVMGKGDPDKGNSGNTTLNFGFNVGSNSTDMAWTNQQTALTGGSVDITVGNKTTLTGAVIASDNNDLTLNTKEFEFKDLVDRNVSEGMNFGLSTSLAENEKGDVSMTGSSSLSLGRQGSEAEQQTRATVGAGNIIVNGQSVDYGDLNRDVNNSQEVTKDQITGGLNITAEVDNRLFSADGVKSIASDVMNIQSNLAKAALGAASTISGPFTALYTSLTAESEGGQKDKTDVITAWKARQAGNATGILRGGSDDALNIAKKIKEGTASPEEIQALANLVSGENSNLMYTQEGEVVDKITGQIVLGFNDIKNEQGYVNLANGTATDVLTFMKTDAEERAHNFTSNESVAKSAAESEAGFFQAAAFLSSGLTFGSASGGIGTALQSEWNKTNTNNVLMAYNTALAGEVSAEDRANSAYFYNGKVAKVTDDGNFKAYNIIGYAIAFGQYVTEEIKMIDVVGDAKQVAKMSAEKKSMIEEALETEKVHGDLLNLYRLSKIDGGSITEKATNLLVTNSLDLWTTNRLNDALLNTADDYTLLNIIANRLTNTLVNPNFRVNDTPIDLYSNVFGFQTEARDFIDATLLSDKRIQNINGAGGYDARRNGGRQHGAIDLLTQPGSPLYAPNDGVVSLSWAPAKDKKETTNVEGFLLVRIKNPTIPSKYNTSAVLYVEPVVKDLQVVKKGQLIGYSSNLKLKQDYIAVPNHTHIRIESFDYKHKINMNVTDPTPLIFKNGKW